MISDATKAISSKRISEALDRLDRVVKEVQAERQKPGRERNQPDDRPLPPS